MKFSEFGDKFSSDAGITSLMEDLGAALSSGSNMIMMGGGNPAHIPEVQQYFKSRLTSLLSSKSDFPHLIGIYDQPQGNTEFIKYTCQLLNDEYNWGVKPENICITNGSQAAFFMIFNLFAGEFSDGSFKQVLLPLAPEYIGYSDTGLTKNFFKSNKPSIEQIDSETFKYHVDFKNLDILPATAALCVSRPTNPTGNVLTDDEINHLAELTRKHDIPLIIDGAYGTPFPNLIFTEANPIWNEHIVLCLSLSKFGLPAARTGIVIADELTIKSISNMNAILNLATGSFGSMLASELMKTKKIISLSNEVIRPYYLNKAQKAEYLLKSLLQGLPFSLHKVEGAMFLWLWLKDCPVTNQTLYLRLKEKGVLIVSGHHFFPGFDADSDASWKHRHECIRITYSQDFNIVEQGLRIIAKEIHLVYQNG